MLSLKGVPSPEIMDKVDKVKKLLISDLNHPWRMIFYKHWIDRFNHESKEILKGVPVDITDSADEIGEFANVFFFHLGMESQSWIFGNIVKGIIGYDMAYRLRIQDMMNEADKYQLSVNPRRELRRLWKTYERREQMIPTYMLPKSKRLFSLILLVLYVPKINKSFRKAVRETDWDKIKFTEEDREWIEVRKDYLFYE